MITDDIHGWLLRVHPGAGDHERALLMYPALSDDGGIKHKPTTKPGQKSLPYMTHKAFPDLRKLAEYAGRMVTGYQTVNKGARQPRDVWVALASFHGDNPHRTAANVSKLKAVWLDVDAKDNGYASQLEAAQAVIKALPRAGWPPPSYIVSSGNGLHVYWTLAEAIEPHQWRPLAFTLRNRVLGQGVRFDGGVTVDMARVLRPAGSANYKDPANPLPVRVLVDNGRDYSLAELPLDPNAVQAPAPAKAGRGTELPAELQGFTPLIPFEGTGEFSAGLQTTEFKPGSMAKVVPYCGILREVHRTGGATCDEPQWRNTLQLCSFAEDGDRWAHDLSKGHPDYDAEATQAKLDVIREQHKHGAFGPVTCATMEATFFTGAESPCRTCRFRTRIKSPVSIPFVRGQLPLDHLSNRLDPPGVFAKLGEKTFHLFPWTIEDIHLVEDTDPHAPRRFSALAWTAVTTGQVERPVQLELTAMADARSMNTALTRQGLSTPENPTSAAIAFVELQRLRDRLRANRAAERPVTGMGWQDGPTLEFFHGRHMLTASGKSAVAVAIPGAEEMQSAYVPKGDLTAWKTVVERIIADGRDEPHAALAAAFASPLLRFAGLDGGMCLVLHSPGTGTGKTTLLQASQSVWGRTTAISQMDDTYNAAIRRLGILRSITGYWDEIRGTSEEIAQHVARMFRIVQGADKQRLKSTAEFQTVATWQLLLVQASNISLLDRAAQLSVGSDAAAARIMEMELRVITNPTIRSVDKAVLADHYGVAGEAFILWLLANMTQARQVVDKALAMAEKAIGPEPALRYLVLATGVLLAGAMIAKAAGVLALDPRKVLNACLTSASRVKSVAAAARGFSSADQLVRDFLQVHQPQTLLLELQKNQTRPTVLNTQLANSKELVAERRIDLDRVLIVERSFRTWLAKSNHDADRKIRDLLTAGARRVQSRIGTDTVFAGPTLPCLVLPGSMVGF